jgi:cell division protein DivIC
MQYLKNLRFLKNFYVITGLALVIWLCFFAQNDFGMQFNNWRKLRNLEAEKKKYAQEIILLKKEQQQTLGNLQLVEKFARERYYMKKTDEDVFVLVDEMGEEVEK